MKNSLAVLLGARIRARRQALRWTQEELADRLGVEVNTISRMECGIRTPSLERLGQIADALRVSAASLLGDASPSSRDQADALLKILDELTASERVLIVEMVKLQATYFQGSRGR
jgi:transcriptional regulator with XRE-family HTH domain